MAYYLNLDHYCAEVESKLRWRTTKEINANLVFLNVLYRIDSRDENWKEEKVKSLSFLVRKNQGLRFLSLKGATASKYVLFDLRSKRFSTCGTREPSGWCAKIRIHVHIRVLGLFYGVLKSG